MEDESPTDLKLFYCRPDSEIKFIDRGAYFFGLLDMTRDSDLTQSFRENVLKRDKKGVDVERHRDLKPWHIIPSAKGSEYMQIVCKWRNNTDKPEIEDINDVRNGVLVNWFSRMYLNSGSFGVLHVRLFEIEIQRAKLVYIQTPNFALSVDEVLPPTTKPHQSTTFHFTPHSLNPECDISEKELLQEFRYPTVVDDWPKDWPPAFLWDFNYGVAIAMEYGNKEAIDTMDSKVRVRYRYYEEFYFPSGFERINPRAQPEVRDEIQNHRKERAQRERSGQHRFKGNEEEQKFLDSMADVLCLSMLFSKSPSVEDESKKQEQEHRLTVEKVNAWRMTDEC
ncbi:hypothetical protein Clacol_004376 [Clathrus columnatus]|uniref:HNH nuclease domain-containing protein n=1 Tax=Clathrus columnatus TaxID=1419009 RepID=A0AAV5ADZ2_9AGAM|nr:hypothetical protein Clacol_004376 [Clathrus columnatus]